MKKLLLSLIVFLFPLTSFAGTLVQSTSSYTASTPQSKAFTSNVTAGNLIVVYVQTNNRTDDPTVTDSLGNTYTKAARATSGATGSQKTDSAVYYAKNILGGANTVTVAWAGDLGFHMAEFSGLDTTDPFVASTTGSGNGTAASATDLTLSGTGTIYSGAGQESSTGTNTAGSGYTLITEQTGHNSFDQHKSYTAGTHTVTATTRSGNWTIIGVAFKDAGGAPAAVSKPRYIINGAVKILNGLWGFK